MEPLRGGKLAKLSEEDTNKVIHYTDFINEELIIQKGKKCFKKVKINNC